MKSIKKSYIRWKFKTKKEYKASTHFQAFQISKDVKAVEQFEGQNLLDSHNSSQVKSKQCNFFSQSLPVSEKFKISTD